GTILFKASAERSRLVPIGERWVIRVRTRSWSSVPSLGTSVAEVDISAWRQLSATVFSSTNRVAGEARTTFLSRAWSIIFGLLAAAEDSSPMVGNLQKTK